MTRERLRRFAKNIDGEQDDITDSTHERGQQKGQSRQSFEIYSEPILEQDDTIYSDALLPSISDIREEPITLGQMTRLIRGNSLLSLYDEYISGTCKVAEATDAPEVSLSHKVCLVRHDITRIEVDAIVNATNTTFLGGGDLDEVILRAAGPALRAELKGIGGCGVGDARMTSAYQLPCRNVIHTVPPELEPDPTVRENQLRRCYRRSLKLAASNALRTIAFPCMGTGRNGYPRVETAATAIDEVRKYLLNDKENSIERVIFCVYQAKDLKVYGYLLP